MGPNETPHVSCYVETIFKTVTELNSESVVQKCSVKNVFLKILQNFQENTGVRVPFIIKLQAEACNFMKKRDSGAFLWILWNF